MSEFNVDSEPESIELEAVVIRADGSREDLGIVAEWHKPSSWGRVKDQIIRLRRK